MISKFFYSFFVISMNSLISLLDDIIIITFMKVGIIMDEKEKEKIITLLKSKDNEDKIYHLNIPKEYQNDIDIILSSREFFSLHYQADVL